MGIVLRWWGMLSLLMALWTAETGAAIPHLSPQCPQQNLLRGGRPPDIRIMPQALHEPLAVELRAAFPLTSAKSAEALSEAGPDRLCQLIYGNLAVNGKPLCGAFGGAFWAEDRIASNGSRLGVALRGYLPETSQLEISAARPPKDCAAAATVTVLAPPGGRIISVSSLPRRVSADEVTWSTRDWRAGQNPWSVSYSFGREGSEPLAPKSWRNMFYGWPLYLVRAIVNPAVAIIAVFLGFALFAPRLGAAVTVAGSSRGAGAALAGATTLLATAQFTVVVAEAGRAVRERLPGDMPRARALADAISRAIKDPDLTDICIGAMLFSGFMLLVSLIFLFARGRHRALVDGRSGDLDLASVGMAASAAYVRGGWIALAGAALALAAGWLLPRDTAFEPLAISISLAVSYGFARIAAALFGAGRAAAAGTAILLAVTLFYPQGGVLTASDLPPAAATNAFYWLRFLSEYLADGALLLLCLVLALRIATGRNAEDRSAVVELLFLFNISIALFGLGDIIDAGVFVLFMFLVRHAVVRPKAGGEPLSLPAARRVAFLAGAIAAAALLVQLAMREVAQSGENRFFLDVYALLRAAVPAAVGALILSRFGNCFPGKTAVLKAALLTLVALGATLAADAEYVVEHRDIEPAVNVIGLATALFVVALVRFDLSRTRVKLRGATLREKLGQSGFSWLVTTLAGLAAAIASAVSPIVFKELGDMMAQYSRDRLSNDGTDHAKTEGQSVDRSR